MQVLPLIDNVDQKEAKMMSRMGGKPHTKSSTIYKKPPCINLLWAACLLVTALPLIQGHLYFLPFLHEARVRDGAPAGQYIMTVVARDDDGNQHITYSLLKGGETFEIENSTGRLSTRRSIRKLPGEKYSLLLVAVSADETQSVPLTVEVTHANLHAPQFQKATYKTEISYLQPVNSTILTVNATDGDTEMYNSEVFYFLAQQSKDIEGGLDTVTASSLLYDGMQDWNSDSAVKNAGYFSIDQRSGALVLRRALPEQAGHLYARVVAQDGGSPTRRNNTWIDVQIKIIPAPRNVTVNNATETNVRLCWQQPLGETNITGYLVWYRSINVTGHASEHTLNVTVEHTKSHHCIYLTSLKAATDYKVMVAGWNSEETGIWSEAVLFNTSVPRCLMENICGNGTCNPLSGLGIPYQCNCHTGFYGRHCEQYNPCVMNPCQNLGTCMNTTQGTYQCQCVAGFSGKDCNDFDPCANKKVINCENGGTCTSNESHEYKCHCPRGYYGPMCQWFDPCSVTPAPCLNGAVCRNESNEHYTCICRPGFTGVHCEEDINECLPSPCFNGATCIDGPHSFTCLCAPGFIGAFCQDEIDECESSPCANGGQCEDQLNTFTCHCPVGFQGRFCDIDIDECESSPCQNGGTCRQSVAEYSCMCPFQYQGPSCDEPVQCQPDIIKILGRSFHYNAANLGDNVSLPCPYGPDGAMAVRSCTALSNEVVWGMPDTSLCQERGLLMAGMMTRKLQNMTMNPSMLGPEEIKNITGEIENILDYAIQNHKIAVAMITIISNVMNANDTAFVSNDVNTSSSRLSNVINRFMNEVKVQSELKIQTENIMIHVLVTNTSENLKNSQQNSSSKNGKRNGGLTLFGLAQSLPEPSQINETEVTIPELTVSNAALQLAASRWHTRPRVHFVAHHNAKFFKEHSGSLAMDRYTPTYRPVLVVNLANTTVKNISEGITFTIQKSLPGKWICVYWEQLPNQLGHWSKEGLTIEQDNENVTCTSSHMTAFSILLDPDPDEDMDPKTSKTLSVISYIGAGLSIIGLLLTILTYSLFRSLNRDKHGKILLNLCVSMLLLNVAFLTGAFRSDAGANDEFSDATSNNSDTDDLMTDEVTSSSQTEDDFCSAIAVLSHYFLLTTFMWMSVEAANMYQLLVYVFATAETHFLLKRCLVAWGVPLIIVGVTAAVDFQYYSYDNDTCLLTAQNPYVYYFTLFGPCCLLLLANTIVFGLVTRILFMPRQTVRLEEKGTKKTFDTVTFAQVRGAFTVMVLLGVAWVFGALAIGPVRILFQYIFCVLNSLQGFLVFLVRCLQYPEARAAWLQLLRTGTLKKYRGTKMTTTTSNSHAKPSNSSSSGAGSSTIYSNHTHSTFDGNGNGMHPITGTIFTRNVPGVTASGALSWNKSGSTGLQSPAWVYGGTAEKRDKLASSFHEDTKEGRDTCWEYHNINRPNPVEARGPWVPETPPMRLSVVGAYDLPYIEDDEVESTKQEDKEEEEADVRVEIRVKKNNRTNKQPLIKTESHSDQGYSTGEHSPTKKKNNSAPTSPIETMELRVEVAPEGGQNCDRDYKKSESGTY